MELETKLRENNTYYPLFLHENNHMKPYSKDNNLELPIPKGTTTYLQDFHVHDHGHQFPLNGSSSNPNFGSQAPIFDQPNFEDYTTTAYGSCENNVGILYDQYYNCSYNKPFTDTTFQSNNGGEYLNIFPSRSNPTEMFGSNWTINLSSSVVPNQVSTITADQNGYYKNQVTMHNKNKSTNYSTTTSCSLMKRMTYFNGRRKIINNPVKGQWTVEEDRILIGLVEEHGVRKWSYIAQMLPGRIGKQCRERWHNHLRPDIKIDLKIESLNLTTSSSSSTTTTFTKQYQRKTTPNLTNDNMLLPFVEVEHSPQTTTLEVCYANDDDDVARVENTTTTTVDFCYSNIESFIDEMMPFVVHDEDKKSVPGSDRVELSVEDNNVCSVREGGNVIGVVKNEMDLVEMISKV
ncbi:hypothetical protein F8388_008957 [Cannabis sativa]|uniref:Uncharacterized protein n=1 Tax=Cannabis sativa TaxID=3483 RepID=A0A7J6EV05_CANSA|nr:hypothetical protein F8388_008957 [Cannabis sativa]KAF4361510.1 hypothetical protein G4B88_016720 [Cannabis sativa]